MKKLILLFTFLLTIAFKGYSQTSREVHGIVADSTGITIPGVVVKLTSATDSLNVVTNVDGVFSFAAVKSKQFALTILSIGYQGLKRNYKFDDDNKPANIGMIKLKTETKMLNMVQITDVNAVKVTTDTTEYKASAYPVRANAPVEDVLKKLPGVDVDKDGNVTSEGKAVNKVRINGKDFFGGDVKTATKNLPADVIESIQMIDDYGDQANLTGLKTGEPNKIMNIVIRKDKNYGYSLSATGGDGSDALPKNPGVSNSNRYVGSVNSFTFKGDQQIALLGSLNNTNVNTFAFSGGNGNGGGGGGGRTQRLGGGGNTPSNGITDAKSIGFNYRDEWGKNLSVYGSYSFADNSVYTVNSSTQKSTDGTFVNQSSSLNTDGTLNHRATFNMEWKPDTINYLKFTPSFSYGSTTTNDNGTNNVSLNGTPNLSYKTITLGNSNSPTFSGNLLYNHKFNAHGRNFSLNLSGSAGPADQYSNPNTTYIVGKPTTNAISPVQYINTHTDASTSGISASYIEPLSKVSFLEANYNFNRNVTNTDKLTDVINDGSTIIVRSDKLSNSYDYTFTTNRFGLNYRLIEKDYNLTLGAAVQPGLLDGSSPATKTSPSVLTHVNTMNYIPTARFVYNFSRSQALSVNYNGSSSQPSFSQLNPRPDSSDATYIVTGNPGLKPEFNNNFSIRYNKFSFGTGNILFTNLSFTQTNDKIVTNVTRVGSLQSVDYRNADGYYSANGFFTYAKPWAQRKYTLIFNGNANYTNNIGYNDNVKNIAKQFTVTPGARFRVDITDVLDVQASVNYAVTSTTNSTAAAVPTYKTTTLGLNGKNYFWKDWTLSYDFSKAINEGYTGAVSNPNILNAYVERRFLKNNMATIRLAAYDLFNENTGYTNTTTGNYVTESNVNRLGRYFLATLTIRLQKFAGKAPSQDPGMPGGRMRREGGGQGGPGGGGGFGGPQ